MKNKRRVIDMNPFFGLTYIEGDVRKFSDLTIAERIRVEDYFKKFEGQKFHRDKSIELAQMALDNVPIPEGWCPNK